MGRWKMNACPRCGGSLFVEKEVDGWYELCINCAYRRELRDVTNLNEKPVGVKVGEARTPHMRKRESD